MELAQERRLFPRPFRRMRALPLVSRRLDGIWCVAARLHVEESDTPEVLHQFRRTLRDGGVLSLVTAAGESQGWEPVPYAPFERRWFVYRRPRTSSPAG